MGVNFGSNLALRYLWMIINLNCLSHAFSSHVKSLDALITFCLSFPKFEHVFFWVTKSGSPCNVSKAVLILTQFPQGCWSEIWFANLIEEKFLKVTDFLYYLRKCEILMKCRVWLWSIVIYLKLLALFNLKMFTSYSA